MLGEQKYYPSVIIFKFTKHKHLARRDNGLDIESLDRGNCFQELTAG